MNFARDIVARCKERITNGGNLLPRKIGKHNRTDDEKIQEYKDATKLGSWKQALKGSNDQRCSNEVKEYLDEELTGWNNDLDEQAMENAREIVERCKERITNGGNLLPRQIHKQNRTDDEKIQEYKDAIKLGKWKLSLKGKGKSKCPNEVKEYLDEELLGWNNDLDASAMKNARDIVDRCKERITNGGNLLPRFIEKHNRTDDEKIQEYKDTQKLRNWKQALKGSNDQRCSNEVKEYLDEELPGWNEEKKTSKKTSKKTPSTNSKEKLKSMKLQTASANEETEEEEEEEDRKENPSERKERVKSEMSELQREYNVLRSDNLHKRFNEEPQLWFDYHAISEENEKSFPEEEIPRNKIITELEAIKTKRIKIVVDMGCGPAHIANHFKKNNDKRFEMINYDHYSNNDDMVTTCDISNLPLEDDSVDICILSLAMMGSNCKEYIKEAHRVLETNGILYIAEPTKRWSEKNEQGVVIEGKEACKLISELESNNFHIKNKDKMIAKFALFVCVKN